MDEKPPLRVLRDSDLANPPRRRDEPIEMDCTPVRVLGDELHKIWWRGRQWAVTAFGVECLDGRYTFKASRLAEDMPQYSWPQHMAEKEWVDSDDFATAWIVGIALHGIKVPGGEQAIRNAIAMGAPGTTNDA